MGALQYVATSALSLTLSGNTGVAPFLTLLLVGIVEKSDPSLLHMEGWIEKIISSWASIAIFAVLSILELVGKCVPCIDAIIDSAMTFVVPILSVFGSASAFGLFTASPEEQQDGKQYIPEEGDGGGGRRLAEEKGGGLIFLQVMLCLIGIGLALLVHLFKLLIRVLGEGCCTCCITSVEYTWTVGSVILTIFIVPIAIGTALLLMVAAGIGFKRKVWDKRKKKDDSTPTDENSRVNQEANTDGDEEQQNKAEKEEVEGSQIDTFVQENNSTKNDLNINPDDVEEGKQETEKVQKDGIEAQVF